MKVDFIKRSRVYCSFIMLVIGLQSMTAQNRTVSGLITDIQNTPLIGVNVIEKGTPTGL